MVQNGSSVGERFDEKAARAILARRQPVSGSVQVIAGRPMFVASDGARSALVYRHQESAASYEYFGRAGVHFQYCPARPEETMDGNYDFAHLEREILECLSADPGAYVFVDMPVNPPREWQLTHLDDVWTAEDGRKWIARGEHPHRRGMTLEAGENFLASFGSPAFLEYGARKVRALADFLRTHEVGKVVIGFQIWGGNDGTFWPGCIHFNDAFPSLQDWQLDHSEGDRKGFQAWLRERYGANVAALRAAWGDSSVSFDTASVCSEADRVSEKPFFRLRGREQRVVDSQRWFSVGRVRMLKYWDKTFKDAIGKPVISMVWQSGDASCEAGQNYYAVSEMMEGPDRLDSASACSAYGEWREVGGIGYSAIAWGSHKLRGTVPVRELDNRPRPPQEFRAAIIRDIGAVASRGMAAWFYEMGDWYTPRPELYQTIAESNRVMEWAHRPDAPASVDEMAVFVDEEAGTRASKNRQVLFRYHHSGQRAALNTSGVPYDVYFLDDIRNPRLPEYKVYLFLSAFTLNNGQLAAIQRRCCGKTTIFLGHPGIGSPDFDDPAQPAGALARVEDATVILLASPESSLGLTAEFLNGTARRAGITQMGTPGQVTHVGSGVAVCHRIRPGSATVTFREPVDLIDPSDGTTLLTQGVSEWNPQCEVNETAVVFYRAAARQ